VNGDVLFPSDSVGEAEPSMRSLVSKEFSKTLQIFLQNVSKTVIFPVIRVYVYGAQVGPLQFP
jgi:hypothetical protein